MCDDDDQLKLFHLFILNQFHQLKSFSQNSPIKEDCIARLFFILMNAFFSIKKKHANPYRAKVCKWYFSQMAAIRAWFLMALLVSICLVKENNAESLGYGALKRDNIPCGPGHEHNCHSEQTEPYERGCSETERCRGGEGKWSCWKFVASSTSAKSRMSC